MRISNTSTDARAGFYRLLSRLYREEVDAPLLSGLKGLRLPGNTGNENLDGGSAAVAAFLAQAGEAALEQLAVDYATVFLAAGSADGAAAIPCESVYTSPKKILMQEAWESVSRLYAAAGLGKVQGREDLMEDHLALELEYMAWLIGRGDTKAQQAFLEEHLLNWVGKWVADVETYARQDFYKGVARLTLGFLEQEGALLAALNDPGQQAVQMAPTYSVRADRWANILARLRERYRVFAPMRFPKRGPKGGDLIRYGEISAITDVEYREKAQFSPKEVFYPVSQTMFDFRDQVCSVRELEDDKEILLLARPCDLNAIRRLDKIFLENGEPDLFYARMREKVTLAMLECRESYENCFCVSMGTNRADNYSLALRFDDICTLVEVRDEGLLPYFQDEVPARFVPQFVSQNPRQVEIPKISSREELEQVCKLEYWNQFDDCCIACGGCNTVCPTCSCFDTVDVIYDETSRDGERRRVWSSCMLRDFTRTAGGGMARKTQGANMRFKVLHKFYDYNLRFGGREHMCVGCGRCVDRCPKDIDYIDVVNGLARQLREGLNHE